MWRPAQKVQHSQPWRRLKVHRSDPRPGFRVLDVVVGVATRYTPRWRLDSGWRHLHGYV